MRLTSALLSKVPHLQHGFLSREGGFSKGPYASLNTSFAVGDDPSCVAQNRAHIAKLFGLSPTALYFPKQTHGDGIVQVDATTDPYSLSEVEADAIYTEDPNVLIGIQTADCGTLLLSDESGQAAMAVHLGWRGAANRLAQKSVRFMCEQLRIQPHQIWAALGPCIGKDAFETGSDVVEALSKTVSPNGLVKTLNGGKFKVDLAGWIARQLVDIGVERIDTLENCTHADAKRFFSHRRDAGLTGRQASVARVTSR